MGLPVIPQEANELIQNERGQLSTFPFPPNIAEVIPKEMRKKIFNWMLQKYIWPQIMERKVYEDQWQKLLEMSVAVYRYQYEKETDPTTRLQMRRNLNALDAKIGDKITVRTDIADTIIFDAVDRLTNLNHFVAFKESLPVRFEIPEDMVLPMDQDGYSPMSSLVKSANSWMRFIARNEQVYRKGWMVARHHYTYGVSFLDKQFHQKIEPVMRRGNNGQFEEKLELTDIGIGFEGISIRKLWLNTRISPYNMQYQHCPFFFEEVPRFAIAANPYDAGTNPFGYQNLENLPQAQYLYGSQEIQSFTDSFKTAYPDINLSFESLLPKELNVELLWTFYAMLPLIGVEEVQKLPQSIQSKIEERWNQDKTLGDEGFIFDEDGSLGLPLRRYITQTFGNNLCNGQQEIIRLQRNFYPRDRIPLAGSAHMPSLDFGAYSPAIGTILESHYGQLCKCLEQFIENKDWANDPPTTIVHGSPAMNHNINKKGAKIPVDTQDDIKRREVVDATGTTPQVMQMLRDQGQTSSKSTDAILGKAMGSRTSATEANNAFTTAMSGVTTDVNLFAFDIYGGWADDVWEFSGLWVDPDLLQRVTGSYGFAIRPEHFNLRLGLKWDIGSSFVESITRQQNIRYMLESSAGDPSINRAALWDMLLQEWKFPNRKTIVNDGGRDFQVQLATNQAIETYLGHPVMVDPSQDHQLAMNIKTAFIRDRKSIWNTTPQYVQNIQGIVIQIQQHQYFLQMQMLQQQLAMRQQMLSGMEQEAEASNMQALQRLQNQNPITTGGAVAQQSGGRL